MALDIKPLRAFIANLRDRQGSMRGLWRLGAWGLGATIALAAVALTSMTERGSERLQMAFAGFGAPVQAANVAEAERRAAAAQAETQRLAVQLRDLTADRDRLAARIASLEHNFDDMTGSIKRQVELAAARATAPDPATLPKIASAAPAAPPPAPAPLPAKTISAEGAAQAAEPPPQVKATIVAPPAAAPAPAAPVPAPAPAPAIVAAVAPPAPAPPAPAPPIPVAVPPDAEPVPIPPRPIMAEIGIDIGGSSTLTLLNARWKTMKANHGPLLVGLHPRVVQEHRAGRLPYRLVLGPLANPAAASRLCALFAAAHAACHPTKYAGEALAQQ